MKNQVNDWILLANNDLYAAEIIVKFGLLPQGIPTIEQVREFIEYAKEIKTIIINGLKIK